MKSLKVRLELNHRQITLARKHAGTAQFAYNWGLAKSKELTENSGKRPTAIDLHKLWVKEVKTQNQWTYEVSKCSDLCKFDITVVALGQKLNYN